MNKKTKITTTDEIHNLNIDNEYIKIVKRFCLSVFSHKIKRNVQPRNQESAETWKSSKVTIRKDSQEQGCVIRDRG